MRDLLEIASGDDEIVEHADWVEISTLFRRDSTISSEDLARAIYQSGGMTEDRAREKAEDTFNELADRIRACGDAKPTSIAAYPFELVKGTNLLRRRLFRHQKNAGLLYLFLLAITRGDMSTGVRILAGHDPTKIFERLCATVLSNYWGGEIGIADAMVMGTAQRGRRSFRLNIQELCENLKEGGGWKPEARSPGAGDAGLDVVVWRRFSDARNGALVGFAQCKTGIHWDRTLGKYDPSRFCTKYMREPLRVDPIQVFMVPCRINRERWADRTTDGGLLLDRCRIVEYGNGIPRRVQGECRAWLKAALQNQREYVRRRRQPR